METLLHTSVRNRANKSLMRLWRIEGKAPFEQLRAWLTLNTSPQRQCDGSRDGLQPYLRQRASLKSCLWRVKPCSATGIVVNQDEGPLSLICSMDSC